MKHPHDAHLRMRVTDEERRILDQLAVSSSGTLSDVVREALAPVFQGRRIPFPVSDPCHSKLLDLASQAGQSPEAVLEEALDAVLLLAKDPQARPLLLEQLRIRQAYLQPNA